MAKLRYRNPKGQFVKEGTPGARVVGYQKGRKIVPLDPAKISASADARGGSRRPTLTYRSNGRIIPKEVAEKLQKTEDFKKAERAKADKFDEAARTAGEIAESIPFHKITETFIEDFVEVFGFKSLEIKEPSIFGGTLTLRFTNLARAREYLRKKTYQAGQIAEKANKAKGKKGKEDPPEGGTPEEVFDIPIFMSPDRPGEYFIEFQF